MNTLFIKKEIRMRVRFAPSPTGYLHIGNARTAILNHLIAKKYNATLVLRIEDTDTERSSKESEDSIMQDLNWLGIEWHEGPDVGGDYGPYRQSERFAIYQKYTDQLLREGKAYHCYCTQEELDSQREAAQKAGSAFVYPGTCRDLTAAQKEQFEKEGRKSTIRIRIPEGEQITFDDHIKGTVSFNSQNIGGDFIIVRSDGSPIYNYIVVIDDALMQISHVIRGEDHLSNTPKQIMVAKALGLSLPEYAHMPLVMGSDRKKLSKRHGITSVNLYREEGYLPESLVNYIALLGWGTESGEEILPLEAIITQIDIHHLAKSSAIFDFQKVKWMNGNYIRNYDLDQITKLFLPFITNAGYDVTTIDSDWLRHVIDFIRTQCELLSDIGKVITIFLEETIEPDAEVDELLKSDAGKHVINAAHELVQNEHTAATFADTFINSVKEKTGLKGKNLFMPCRAVLTSSMHGPDLVESIKLIGFKTCKKRIEYMYKKYV
jgi:nondiscriminating glutamyl-tRNA synthetase